MIWFPADRSSVYIILQLNVNATSVQSQVSDTVSTVRARSNHVFELSLDLLVQTPCFMDEKAED